MCRAVCVLCAVACLVCVLCAERCVSCVCRAVCARWCVRGGARAPWWPCPALSPQVRATCLLPTGWRWRHALSSAPSGRASTRAQLSPVACAVLSAVLRRGPCRPSPCAREEGLLQRALASWAGLTCEMRVPTAGRPVPAEPRPVPWRRRPPSPLRSSLARGEPTQCPGGSLPGAASPGRGDRPCPGLQREGLGL